MRHSRPIRYRNQNTLCTQVSGLPACSRPCRRHPSLVCPAHGGHVGQSQASPRQHVRRHQPLCRAPHCGHGAAQPAAGPRALPTLFQVQKVLLLHLLRADCILRNGHNHQLGGKIRAVDPHSIFADPDTAFFLEWGSISSCFREAGPDPALKTSFKLPCEEFAKVEELTKKDCPKV